VILCASRMRRIARPKRMRMSTGMTSDLRAITILGRKK
jgi:hypothetical protein